MTITKDLYENMGGNQRFLAEYAKIKAAHNLSHEEFILSIGFTERTIINSLQANRISLSARLLANTKRVYPEFDLDYILMSDEVPEVSFTAKKPGKRDTPIKRTERTRRTREQMGFDRLKLVDKIAELKKKRIEYEQELNKKADESINKHNHEQIMKEVYTDAHNSYNIYKDELARLQKEVTKLDKILSCSA